MYNISNEASPILNELNPNDIPRCVDWFNKDGKP